MKWAFVFLIGLIVVGGVTASVTYGTQKSMENKDSDETSKEKFYLFEFKSIDFEAI